MGKLKVGLSLISIGIILLIISLREKQPTISEDGLHSVLIKVNGEKFDGNDH